MKKIISLALCVIMLVVMMVSVTSCGADILVGVQTGTTGEYFVNGNEDWGFDGIKGYAAKGYSNGGLAVADMKNGGVEYVIIDKAPAIQLEKAVDGIKVINIDLTEETYAFGVDKAQPKLRESINKILKDKKTDIQAIIDKYAQGKDIKPIESAKYDSKKNDTQLVVATNAAFPPFEYKEGNKFAGIDIEIMKLVADELKMELVIVDMEFDSVVTSVGKNGIDVAAAGLSVNDTRKQSVDFTDTYYDAAQVLIVLDTVKDFDACKTADDVLKKLKDLK